KLTWEPLNAGYLAESTGLYIYRKQGAGSYVLCDTVGKRLSELIDTGSWSACPGLIPGVRYDYGIVIKPKAGCPGSTMDIDRGGVCPLPTPTPTPTPPNPWWQVVGGSAYGKMGISSNLYGGTYFIETEPPLEPPASGNDSAGIPMCREVGINTGSGLPSNPHEYNVIGQPDYVCTNYSASVIARQLGITSSMTAETIGTPITDLNTILTAPEVIDLSIDTDTLLYLHSGDLILNPASNWNLGDDKLIIYNDGNVTIHNTNNIVELISLGEKGFFGIVSTGEVTIDANVGSAPSAAYSTPPNWEGLIFTDGVITLEGFGTNDKKLLLSGSYIGCGGVDLQRILPPLDALNNPTEVFIYNPQLAKNTPPELKESQIIWQESL
ncbi:MAG TPA: hypothetical protein PKX78_00825, partial [Candidatus Woesebacteria bacterium]|nr:hypothetical protein [Candidatus Woesebacteria bacterium]